MSVLLSIYALWLILNNLDSNRNIQVHGPPLWSTPLQLVQSSGKFCRTQPKGEGGCRITGLRTHFRRNWKNEQFARFSSFDLPLGTFSRWSGTFSTRRPDCLLTDVNNSVQGSGASRHIGAVTCFFQCVPHTWRFPGVIAREAGITEKRVAPLVSISGLG